MTVKHNLTGISLSMVSLAALILAGCAANAPAASSNNIALTINAIVAATLTAEPTNTPTPTPTLIPTLVPTETPTATMTPTATLSSASVVGAYSTYSLSNNICDNSTFVADVTIPDYTIVAPGQVFQKTWLLENTGTCAWAQNYRMEFVGGVDLAGSPKKIGQVIEPGQEAYLTVTFTAPEVAGEYASYWHLSDRMGNIFGESVYVLIDVPTDLIFSPTATSTPTDTPTTIPTATSTATPPPQTNTSIPTFTPTPLSTDTPPPPTITLTPTFTSTPLPTDTSTPTPTPTSTLLPSPTPTPSGHHRKH